MRSTTRLVLLAAGLVLAVARPSAVAAPPGPGDGQAPGQTAAPTRAELVAAIRKDHEEALRSYYKVFETMKDDAEIQAYFEKNPPPAAGPWIERAWAIVDADPKDDAALSALLFVCEEDIAGPGMERAFAKAMEHHAASERLSELVLCLERSSHAVGLPRLRELAAKAKSRSVQGIALRSTATVLLESAAFAAKIQSMGAEELADSYGKWMSPEELDAERKADPAAMRAEGEALLERVIKEYGDVPAKRGGTLGKACELQLYALRNLAIGKVAPEIEGKDFDGAAFKLSDYRGKVVVLDFWGDW